MWDTLKRAAIMVDDEAKQQVHVLLVIHLTLTVLKMFIRHF